MKGMLQHKNIAGSVKDVDVKNRVVTGYLSTFGNVDKHNDIIEKGAFTKSLNERAGDVYFLNQHNWAQPHGKFAVLKEDNQGLYFESNPLIDTSYSTDALKLYEAGIMDEHSIGFTTMKTGSDVKTGANVIKEVKLYEGSNVTVGANPQAKLTGLKALTIGQIDDKINKIVKCLKNGTLTDDGFMLLELSLKELQKQSFLLGQKSTKKRPEPIATKEALVINHFARSIKKKTQ